MHVCVSIHMYIIDLLQAEEGLLTVWGLGWQPGEAYKALAVPSAVVFCGAL